jgi:hypothetical protein
MKSTKIVYVVNLPEEALNLPKNQNLERQVVVTAAEIVIALDDNCNLQSQDEVVARAFKHLTQTSKTDLKKSKSIKVIDWLAWNSFALGVVACFYIALLGVFPKLLFERCNPGLQNVGKNIFVSDAVKDLNIAIECLNSTNIPYTQSTAYTRLLKSREYLKSLPSNLEVVSYPLKVSLQDSVEEIENKVNRDWIDRLIIGFLILTGSLIIYRKKTNSIINRHCK